MKKEKKRELTIKQLENRAIVTKWMENFFFIMSTIGMFAIASILIVVYTTLAITITFWNIFIPTILIAIISGIIACAFESKTQKYENTIIKRMAGKGNIKDKVILRSGKYLNTIFNHYFVTYIKLGIMKNNTEDLIESREQKKKIVNSIIQSIEIEKAEEETMNVIIKVDSGECIETKVPEEKLIEMFDLKTE